MAVWTPHQVARLKRWQACSWVHPLTCGGDHGTQGDRVLTVAPDGVVCRKCGYRQTHVIVGMLEHEPPPHPATAIG